MVELLIPLQKGAKDKDGNTAFVHAIKSKHADVAMVLREYEAPSWTFLMCAAFIGDVWTAKQHLSDKDKKNSDGDTALILAARAEHANIVKLLDPTDERGVTALMRAAEKGDVKAVRALIPLQKGRKTGSFCDNRTALMMAAARGHAKVVKLLVEYESGMKDENGYTALMLAAENDHTDCVKLLLEKEAGMQAADGWTALMKAAFWNKPECARLLVERETEIRHAGGKTALDIAKNWGHTEVISILTK